MVLIITGCGTARTLVLEPVETTTKYTNVKIVADNPNVNVPSEVIEIFESTLRKGLYDDGVFTNGEDLRIHYTFISHDPGNQFERWFWGGLGNAGEGSITIIVTYKDLGGNEITKTQVEGRIGSGFFGGSMNAAIEKAGEDIVEYTKNQFAPGINANN
jgi:hypothetical protein